MRRHKQNVHANSSSDFKTAVCTFLGLLLKFAPWDLQLSLQRLCVGEADEAEQSSSSVAESQTRTRRAERLQKAVLKTHFIHTEHLEAIPYSSKMLNRGGEVFQKL